MITSATPMQAQRIAARTVSLDAAAERLFARGGES